MCDERGPNERPLPPETRLPVRETIIAVHRGCVTNCQSRPRTWVSASNSCVDIRSIKAPHETPAELSRSPGDDGVASRLPRTGARNVPFGPRRGCRRPSKSAPHVSVGLYRVNFDIRSIEARLETPAEPFTSPGDGGITSRLHLLPVHESVPRERCAGHARTGSHVCQTACSSLHGVSTPMNPSNTDVRLVRVRVSQ